MFAKMDVVAEWNGIRQSLMELLVNFAMETMRGLAADPERYFPEEFLRWMEKCRREQG